MHTVHLILYINGASVISSSFPPPSSSPGFSHRRKERLLPWRQSDCGENKLVASLLLLTLDHFNEVDFLCGNYFSSGSYLMVYMVFGCPYWHIRFPFETFSYYDKFCQKFDDFNYIAFVQWFWKLLKCRFLGIIFSRSTNSPQGLRNAPGFVKGLPQRAGLCLGSPASCRVSTRLPAAGHSSSHPCPNGLEIKPSLRPALSLISPAESSLPGLPGRPPETQTPPRITNTHENPPEPPKFPPRTFKNYQRHKEMSRNTHNHKKNQE